MDDLSCSGSPSCPWWMKTPQFSRSTARSEAKDGLTGLRLPFGYHLQCDADLLILRRSDASFVTAFGVGNVDPFEVEYAVWEDAD
jgi:hypothetical protein